MPLPPPNHCPVCGAIVPDGSPDGSCSRCLLQAAMQPTGPEDAPRHEPPSLAAVSAAFPQLEILELIGHGGMGAVFKARQPKLDRMVALKLLPASLAERDPAFTGRFEREGRLLARLHHPNIVVVHDSGTAGGFFYLLMEFVEGVNLRQAMRSRRFTPAQALAIVPHICDALQFAHDEGVLHRDIKPENILLDAKGRVKLADFGIAKLVGDGMDGAHTTNESHKSDPEFTQSGSTLGTPNYMAPEQRDTPGAVDHRADIYSLGVVFYELLTGELPVGKFAPPSTISAADPRVDAIVRQALEKDREHRQHSAGEVKTQVETLGMSRSSDHSTSGKAIPVAHPIRSTLVLHGILFALIGALFRFAIPRFANIFDDMGAALPFVTQVFLKLGGDAAGLGFALIFGIDVGFCYLARSLGGRPGLRVWSGAVFIGCVLTAAASFAALSLPLMKIVTDLNAPITISAASTISEKVKQPLPSAVADAANGDSAHLESVSSRDVPRPSDLEGIFTEYEQLLTALREATFELDLADFSEGTDAERAARRADIKTRCDGLAEQTSRLREKILALGKRAADSRER